VKRFGFDRSFRFPVGPEDLWRTMEQFDQFEVWWSWLRQLEADHDGLVAGNVLHGVVMPPVPYRLRVDVRLASCERPRLVEAIVSGDLLGRARLRLNECNGGTEVSASWSLEMGTRTLRLAADVAHPLMRWGHDRVVDMAVEGFRKRALPVHPAR
jgi:hypothetical protein